MTTTDTPAELLIAEACAVNVRMRERDTAFKAAQRADRELRALLLLRASRAGATYAQLADACPELDARTISTEIREARSRTDDKTLKKRLPRARRGVFPCLEDGCEAVFDTGQGLGLHRLRVHEGMPAGGQPKAS